VNHLGLAARQGRLELRQFFRSRAAVVFTMAFPVMMVVVFSAIFKAKVGAGVSFTQYCVTGIIASGLMTVGFQSLAIQLAGERENGILKRFRGTPMPAWVFFAGKVLLVLTIAALETAILLAISTIFFDMHLPGSLHAWTTLAWVSLLGITACTLCGIAFSSLLRRARSAPALVTPVALLLQFTSGVFYIFTELPSWMQQFAALFPLKWMCQGLRSVFLPAAFAKLEPGHSWELGRVALVLGAWCVIGLVLSVRTFRWTEQD